MASKQCQNMPVDYSGVQLGAKHLRGMEEGQEPGPGRRNATTWLCTDQAWVTWLSARAPQGAGCWALRTSQPRHLRILKTATPSLQTEPHTSPIAVKDQTGPAGRVKRVGPGSPTSSAPPSLPRASQAPQGSVEHSLITHLPLYRED